MMFCKACKQNHPLKSSDKWCDRSEIEIIRDDLVDKFETAIYSGCTNRDKEIEELKAENARYRKAIEAAKDLLISVDVREWPEFGARKFHADPSVNATIAADNFKKALKGE